MLRTDLIDLINSGDAWAFVGSGVSVDAGLPGWGELVSEVVAHLAEDEKATLLGQGAFARAHSKKDWPRCFSAVEAAAGRPRLEALVRQELDGRHGTGRLIELLVDWPFAGYITSNYDGLIETSLRPIARGWPAVGNSSEEIRKVAGGAKHLVWHIHGALDLPPDAARLILTQKDYDDLYLEQSPLESQLKAFLQHHRIVFVGFGFQDPELGRLLRLTARYSNAALPAFAFLPDVDDVDRRRLLEENNVDVVPYPGSGADHSLLGSLLQTYDAFVIRRSLKFGQAARPVPSYDAETTGLMLFNGFVLRGGAKVRKDVGSDLLRAHVLALLKYRGEIGDSEVIQDLEEKARLISGSEPQIARQEASAAVHLVLRELMQDGLVVARAVAGGDRLARLSSTGHKLVAEQAASAELRARQFSTSLLDRANVLLPNSEAGARRVAAAAEGFLKECVERRALGVAMTQASAGQYQQFHMVALLQSLPEFMKGLQDHSEAAALVGLIEGVLAAPEELEASYLGLALQARFGIHLLGFDPDALHARLASFADTLFLVDSSTVIHFMARSSTGYDAARLLVRRLRDVGAAVSTTDGLTVEVAEHARWGLDHVAGNGMPNRDTVLAAAGRSGFRRNEFLDGFLQEVATGGAPDFRGYLESVFGRGGSSATDSAVQAAIEREGIPATPMSEWEGFTPGLWTEANDLAEQITESRKRKLTYRHERQVKAEAEALAIIGAARQGTLKRRGSRFADAFFVSPMRVIEDHAQSSGPVLRPDALLQWVNTLVPCAPDELTALYCALVSELADRGVGFVNREQLRAVFSPLADASKEHLAEEVRTNHEFMANRWGADASPAFAGLDGIDAIVAEKPYYKQKADQLQRELDLQQVAREAAVKTERLNQKEREQLNRLTAEDEGRRRKKLRKKRSIDNRRKRGKQA